MLTCCAGSELRWGGWWYTGFGACTTGDLGDDTPAVCCAGAGAAGELGEDGDLGNFAEPPDLVCKKLGTLLLSALVGTCGLSGALLGCGVMLPVAGVGGDDDGLRCFCGCPLPTYIDTGLVRRPDESLPVPFLCIVAVCAFCAMTTALGLSGWGCGCCCVGCAGWGRGLLSTGGGG